MASVNAVGMQNSFSATAPQGANAGGGAVQGSQASSQTDSLMQMLQQISKQMKAKPAATLATSYLKGKGMYKPQPLEKQVEVKKADDSGYWSALGYDA